MDIDEETQPEDQDNAEDVCIQDKIYLTERAAMTDLSQPYLSYTALFSLALRSALRKSLRDIPLPKSLWSDFKKTLKAHHPVSFCRACVVALIGITTKAMADETKEKVTSLFSAHSTDE